MSQSAELKERVTRFLKEELAPILHADGSKLELLDVSDGVARVRLGGVCGCCPGTAMMMIHGMEQELRRRFPEIEYLEAVP